MRKLYSVGEMAGLFGLSRPTLIYYDNIGLFRPARVNEAGHRLYLPTQIPTLRLICLLKDLGVELKEIAEIIHPRNIGRLVGCLSLQRDDVDERIAELSLQRDMIDQRIAFQRGIDEWLAVEERPTLRFLERRLVVTERFPRGSKVDRSVLHPTLMRSIMKMRGEGHRSVAPVSGFGTTLRCESVLAGDALAGAGTFVVVPEGTDASGLDDVLELPSGIYACLSYWGMPYDGSGSARLMGWLDEHRFAPQGDLFDFCLLDTCFYDERHQQDFCCIQVRIDG